MYGFICPDCKVEKYVPEYEEDGFYVCADCGRPLGYVCSGCPDIYNKNRLGKHGDVYECKICGKIQWGFTEFMRKKEKGRA